jgi:methylthioribose-1-phosphate isomerase
VAPESTVDLDTAIGDDIEIEDRGPAEVASVGGHRIAPDGIDAINPAFDVTPAGLITAIVTDRRVVRLDKGETLQQVSIGPLRRPVE